MIDHQLMFDINGVDVKCIQHFFINMKRALYIGPAMMYTFSVFDIYSFDQIQ